MSVKTSCQGDGFSTSALPPPRRTGSAAACTAPPGRKAMLVAAPRSGVETRVWPRSDTRSFAFGVLRYAGSAEVSVVCAARLAGRLSEVQVVDESLQDDCDDRGPSGRSEGEHGVSVARNDRGANTAPRALATFGGVGEPRCRMFFVYSSDP